MRGSIVKRGKNNFSYSVVFDLGTNQTTGKRGEPAKVFATRPISTVGKASTVVANPQSFKKPLRLRWPDWIAWSSPLTSVFIFGLLSLLNKSRGSNDPRGVPFYYSDELN